MMKESVKDEGILFGTALKWLLLSVFAGVLAGGGVGAFLILINASVGFVAGLPEWRYALIPAGLLLSLCCVRFLSPQSAGHGTEKVLEDIHFHAGNIPFNVVPGKVLSTLFTLAPGGVVGVEGPGVQIGAGLLSRLSRRFRLHSEERKQLVICGVSAALSAVFGAPVAGAVFGVEMLFVGEIFYTVLPAAVISSIASYLVCLQIGVPYGLPAVTVPDPTPFVLAQCFAAAVFFALICIFHIEFTSAVERTFKKIPCPLWVKSLIASALLLCTAAVWGDEFLGMGESGLAGILSGHSVVWYAFILKSFLLAVTLSGGGSGGVLTPTFYIGAAAGSLFAAIFGLDTAFFGALGFVGCIAGCVNTPIAATFLAVELFGSAIAPFAGCVCVISYMLSGHRSLYPTQILVRPKSLAFVLADPQNKESWATRKRPEYLPFSRIVRKMARKGKHSGRY